MSFVCEEKNSPLRLPKFESKLDNCDVVKDTEDQV